MKTKFIVLLLSIITIGGYLNNVYAQSPTETIDFKADTDDGFHPTSLPVTPLSTPMVFGVINHINCMIYLDFYSVYGKVTVEVINSNNQVTYYYPVIVGNGNYQIDVSGLSPGAYKIRCRFPGGVKKIGNFRKY